MRTLSNYQNQRVLVLGAGMSGVNAAKLLKASGAQVVLSDNKPLSKLPKAAQKLSKPDSGIKVSCGRQSGTILDHHFDLMVKSPGISYDNPVVKRAVQIDLPITVEVELASQINPGNLINITGSNGKTTTTLMIAKMLDRERKAGHAYEAGNIGVDAVQVAQKMTPSDTMVMEISSFMLLGISHLHPHVAVITNIKSNHLDYHKTRANYVRAKMRITKNQTANDYLVINFNSKELQTLSHDTRAQVVPFCTNGSTQAGAYEEHGKLCFRGHYVMDAADVYVHGQYNVENALAAIAVAKLAGRSDQNIRTVLTTFKGASHRNQYVLSYQGRKFFDDSKSTDIDSTLAALNSFKAPVILLAGGLDRGYTFERLVPGLANHVKGIALFGQTVNLLKRAAVAAKVPHIKSASSFDQAIPAAYAMSSKGDVILLSPANASWDQFPNFEVRGDRYIKDVKKLIQARKEK